MQDKPGLIHMVDSYYTDCTTGTLKHSPLDSRAEVVDHNDASVCANLASEIQR